MVIHHTMFENDDIKKECLHNLSKIINQNKVKQIKNNDLNILSRLSNWYV